MGHMHIKLCPVTSPGCCCPCLLACGVMVLAEGEIEVRCGLRWRCCVFPSATDWLLDELSVTVAASRVRGVPTRYCTTAPQRRTGSSLALYTGVLYPVTKWRTSVKQQKQPSSRQTLGNNEDGEQMWKNGWQMSTKPGSPPTFKGSREGSPYSGQPLSACNYERALSVLRLSPVCASPALPAGLRHLR
jgi:hypothetical protein